MVHDQKSVTQMHMLESKDNKDTFKSAVEHVKKNTPVRNIFNIVYVCIYVYVYK